MTAEPRERAHRPRHRLRRVRVAIPAVHDHERSEDPGVQKTHRHRRARKSPAAELAAAYHERWEAELVIDELKTHQRGPGMILRSRKPELVEQEIWGLLLTHYGIRHLMREAADPGQPRPGQDIFHPRAPRCPPAGYRAGGFFSLGNWRGQPGKQLRKSPRDRIQHAGNAPVPARLKEPSTQPSPLKQRSQKNIQHDSPPTIRLFRPAA
jgi:hypothetical protein